MHARSEAWRAARAQRPPAFDDDDGEELAPIEEWTLDEVDSGYGLLPGRSTSNPDAVFD